MNLMFLTRLLTAIASLGAAASALAATGALPKAWLPYVAALAVIGTIAAKFSKTPSQAIAAAVPSAPVIPPLPPGAAIPVLMLLALASALSCATVKPTVLTCAKGVAPEILPRVETALASNDYETQLAGIAKDFGACVIRDAILHDVVAEVVAENRADSSAAASDQLARARVKNGTSWLAAHPASP